MHSILYNMRVDSHVMMWIQIHARGVQGMLPKEDFKENGAIWRILSVPQYVIINIIINIFKYNFPKQ